MAFSLMDSGSKKDLYKGQVLISSGIYHYKEYADQKAIINGQDEKDLSIEVAGKFFEETASFF
ncbi:hypothetical protein [Jeongeupia sp. USM3]|uniref:hypothetical protein n=1 Tax=Jeongeupia sp. USM3 TaxID=1906741 RepID=UPI0011AB393E|nr:hypothetical protein [Jeongeupia sp. USM3]